jgi:hypothetical protein
LVLSPSLSQKKMPLSDKSAKAIVLTVYILSILTFISVTVYICITLSRSSSGTKPDMHHAENGYVVVEMGGKQVLGQQVGGNGRLGNQFFQVAATLGAADSLHKTPLIYWPMGEFLFEKTDICDFGTRVPKDIGESSVQVGEDGPFAYKPIIHACDKNVDVGGFRQNVAYFNHVLQDIRRVFTFQQRHIDKVKSVLPCLENTCIGVHVRRGDIVCNPIFKPCSVQYYLFSIERFRSLYPHAPVVVCTDDKEWCRENFKTLDNVVFSPFEEPWEDFICLYLCEKKVISNSTFSWWSAFLDVRASNEVCAPYPWIFIDDDKWKELYDSNWYVYDLSADTLLQTPTSPVLTIGAYYQCYKQAHAFFNVCQAFRRVYPTSSLVVVNDAGDSHLEAIARHFAATSYTTNPTRGGNGRTTLLGNLEAISLWVSNFLRGAKQMKEKWFVLLEDDVCIYRPARILDTESADIIGCNDVKAILPSSALLLLRQTNRYPASSYYGGCGGTLFRTAFWSGLDVHLLQSQLRDFASVHKEFHSDIVLSYLCLVNNGRVACGRTLFSSEMTEVPVACGTRTTPAILHQHKRWYDKPLTEAQQLVLSQEEESQNSHEAERYL